MAGVENAVKSSNESWFSTSLDWIGGLANRGLEVWGGIEQIKGQQEANKIKNQMTQNEGEVNTTLMLMQGQNQKFLQSVMVIGGLCIAGMLIYKMFR